MTSGVPTGVEMSALRVVKGLQIEEACAYPDSLEGMAIVTVQESCEGTFSVNVAFSFVHWNMYVE